VQEREAFLKIVTASFLHDSEGHMLFVILFLGMGHFLGWFNSMFWLSPETNFLLMACF